jgi:hypothetical protein
MHEVVDRLAGGLVGVDEDQALEREFEGFHSPQRSCWRWPALRGAATCPACAPASGEITKIDVTLTVVK